MGRVSNCELVSARKPWKIKSDRRKENKLDVVLKDLSVHGTNAGRLVGRQVAAGPVLVVVERNGMGSASMSDLHGN